MKRRRTVALGLLLTAVALPPLAPASAPARGIAVRKVAIAGVSLHMTKKKVLHILGAPKSRRRKHGEIYLRYPDRLLVGLNKRGRDGFSDKHAVRWRVDLVVTRSPRDSFANGIHVGSRYRAARKAFPDMSCFNPGEGEIPLRHRLRRPGNGDCFRSDGIYNGCDNSTQLDFHRFRLEKIRLGAGCAES